MPQAKEELIALADALDAVVAQQSAPEVKEGLSRLEAAATEVGRAASGSWIGYHADVYYTDRQPPPAGRHFNAEWGFRTAVGRRPVTDWVECRPEEVQREILSRAGVSDLSEFTDRASRSVTIFKEAQATIASILRVSLAAHADTHLEEVLRQSQELTTKTLDADIQGRIPSQTFSRDSLAVSQGRRVPPHVMVLARVAVARSPLIECGKLATIARHAAAHLERRAISNGPTASPTLVKGDSASPSTHTRRRFRVSLSFAGERRKPVAAIAQTLAQSLEREEILYDRWHEAEFSRANLDLHIQRLYRDESDLIAVFLSKEYGEKEWCGLEWNAIRELTNAKLEDRVMFLRFDKASVPGIFTHTGHTWIGEGTTARPASEIAALIMDRVTDLQSYSTNGPSRGVSTVTPTIRDRRSRPTTVIGYVTAIALVIALVYALFHRREKLKASCVWSSQQETMVLTCTLVNNTAEDLRDVRLRLPFIVRKVTIDGREGSPFLGPESFVEKPRPPIWFKIEVIEPDRPRAVRFVPQPPTRGDDQRRCQASSYTIRIGPSPTPIPVEVLARIIHEEVN